MRISIVGGFFLPIPPVSGGATEKSWYNLARQFADRGHHVTFISRRWSGFPNLENSEGIQHVRLPGADHRRKLWQNLLHDFIWSWRAFFALPSADIVVVNAIALPAWLGWLKPRAGRVVIMTGRMPKGQYRRYSSIARILAPSSFVRDQVVAENRSFSTLTRVSGYPINWQLINFSTSHARSAKSEITIGYVGRIHEEKGLLLLTHALQLVAKADGVPSWRLILCGPSDVARGGSGAIFRDQLVQNISTALPNDRFTLLDPQFDEGALAAIYRQMDIFCYPSLAAKGETFGVSVAEAMAAGAVPVVSHLACFTDFVRHEKNGLVFDHNSPDAAVQLATALMRLLREATLCESLAAAAQQTVKAYDYSNFADSLLEDFSSLLDPASRKNSSS